MISNRRWDNLLRGKFSKEWRIQQKAHKTRIRLVDPIKYDRIKRKKKRKQEQKNETNKNKKTRSKSKTEYWICGQIGASIAIQ